MSLYCTIAQFESTIEGWVTTNSAVLDRILVRAERDVDRVLGPIGRNLATGLKLDPTKLLAYEAAALARAVAVQAHHRILKGEGIATPPATVEQVAGPDFTISYANGATVTGTGATGLISPLVAAELEPLARLRPTAARATA